MKIIFIVLSAPFLLLSVMDISFTISQGMMGSHFNFGSVDQAMSRYLSGGMGSIKSTMPSFFNGFLSWAGHQTAYIFFAFLGVVFLFLARFSSNKIR